MLGAMVGLTTVGDMQVRFQVGSDHPSDWIQDPSAWSHPTIRVIGFRIRVLGAMVGLKIGRKLNQASYWKGDLVYLPSMSKIDLARIRVQNSKRNP